MGNDDHRGGLLGDRVSMAPDGPSPHAVKSRLAALRALYQPERDVDARARLAREQAVHVRSARPFAISVAERLHELRALCELAAHLHRTHKPRNR